MSEKRFYRLWLRGAFLGALFLGGTLSAGEAVDVALEEKATYWELFFTYGREINLTLAGLAFVALFLFFYLLLISRRSLTVPGALLQEMLDDIASGDIERASQRATKSRSLLGHVLLPALRLHDHPLERLHPVTEGAGRRAVGSLRQKAVYLANIGVLSPMLGLLGTVLGMITAFQSFATELDISAKQAMFTASIGKALITTAVGLIVGIPSMAAFYFASGRINRISDDLELAAEDVIASLRESA
ncbi:MAG: MotA/TolQ/ExbB proton channel family protein [Planctomycetota bacterium]